MFCRFCGREITGKEEFCPGCGQRVTGVETNGTENEEKKNWKDYITMDHIERFAPAAALVPLGMALVVGIIGGILFLIFPWGVGRGVANVIVFLLKAIFCVTTLGATVGLSYVVVKEKDMANIWAWIAPAATFCAFISCISIAFSWNIVAWIFGLIAFVIGLELLARITIAGNSMDSKMDPAVALETYKGFYQSYREKYPTTKDLERAGAVDTENSYFDGNGIELLGYTLLATIISVVTCGIATPWMICKLNKWRLEHTVINGKRLTFNGTGGSLLGHWILWEILTIITCGIYGFFTYVALRKWELNHIFIDGEPIIPNQTTSYFDGNSFEFLGYGLLGGLLLCVTCGIAYPWVMCMIQKWDTKHQVINGRRLVFSGSGLGFLGEYIIIALLSLITCGIYAPWGTVRMNKYIIKNTDFC